MDCQDVNSATNGFTQGLSDLISSTFPVCKSNRKTTYIHPWMSNSLIISSYCKNDLYKLACKTSSVIDLTNYKTYKNYIQNSSVKKKKKILFKNHSLQRELARKITPSYSAYLITLLYKFQVPIHHNTEFYIFTTRKISNACYFVSLISSPRVTKWKQ